MDSKEFINFMLRQSGSKRFTDEQLNKAMQKHNKKPSVHILIQLAEVGFEENVFTEEEKKMILPTYKDTNN